MKTTRTSKFLILFFASAGIFGLSDRELDLFRAVLAGNLSSVQNALAAKVTPNIKEPQMSRTPLHAAAQLGHMDIAKALIAKKADLNAKDNSGNTPLHYAVSNGRPNMVAFLTKSKANVNAANNL
ncbi:MAG: ankyrin repeat domain-containing protein, partial [Leptospiraceae bacterium]|nr:ankyrin repeat domain-containing protein [Leptospiraceae bacterium]